MSTSVSAARQSVAAATLPPVVYPLLGSALAWAVLFASLPAQDFPLNDDWAFARGAFLFSRGEGIHYGNWASMPQLGQWLWSCPFLWLLGPSHVALRLSTVCLSWLGLWAFCDLLGQAGWPARRAALATAALAFDPLFFLLQGTFMTDVPALSFALLALAAYARGLRGGAGRWLVLACVWACLGALTRQNTLAVSAAACVLLWQQRELRRGSLAWLAVLLPAALGLAVHFWFQARQDVRAMAPSVPAPAALLSLPFIVVHFCGLAALPLLLLRPWVESWKTFAVVSVILLAAASYWLLYGVYLPYGGLFPYAENILGPEGALTGGSIKSGSTGPLVGGERPILLGIPARVFLTLLGCVAGAALLTRVGRRWRPGVWASPLVLFTLLQVPFLLIAREVYDRYLLFLLPGALALAGQPAGDECAAERPGLASLATVALLALASVGLMHDWLAWNGARWELGRRAIERHIDPLDIEGGVEWDGWFAGPGTHSARTDPRRWPVLPFTGGWFPAVRGRYWLSFSELPGARRLDAEPYSLWLLPGRRQFFLLEIPQLPQRQKP